ncbi:MAG TPA: twin-arginine translocation pathway signal, partial [Fuerstia sp.]|nr:twin-arginine translocation pathway signal [Fuerstiella sp.]
MTSFTRRLALKLLGLGSALVSSRVKAAWQPSSTAYFPRGDDAAKRQANDRVWLGRNFWANPMEDWRIVDGAAECQTSGGDRNVHLLTHQITNVGGSFQMSVEVEQIEVHKRDGGAGFRVGIRSDLNEHRSNSFANGGVNAGVVDGQLILGRKRTPIGRDAFSGTIVLEGKPDGQKYSLTLTAKDVDGRDVTVTQTVPQESIIGNIAIVNNFDPKLKKGQGARYRFSNWEIAGDAFTVNNENRFGPILWSMYTLSDSRGPEGFVLKMSALTPPMGDADNKTVELQVERNGSWKSLGHAGLDPDAWVATFRVSNWDESSKHSYRLVYHDKTRVGRVTTDEWAGTIQANPVGRPLRIGALTCQNHYAFPYAPVADNVVKLDPDMLYFSGDQLYESHGGYGLIRDPAGPAILNYLRKFYMFGWSFREAMRDRPTVCIPDDHDVFQGNIWGEGGAPMAELDKGASSKGGYREPARMVNVVHKTCAAHHPDYFDPTPCAQNISVYYGDMVYGNVGFAILGDR